MCGKIKKLIAKLQLFYAPTEMRLIDRQSGANLESTIDSEQGLA